MILQLLLFRAVRELKGRTPADNQRNRDAPQVHRDGETAFPPTPGRRRKRARGTLPCSPTLKTPLTSRREVPATPSPPLPRCKKVGGCAATLATTAAEKPGGDRHIARLPCFRRRAGKGGAPSRRRGRCPPSRVIRARSSRRSSPARSFSSRRLRNCPPLPRHSSLCVASSARARPR